MASPKYLWCVLIIRIWSASNKKKTKNNHRNNGMSKWKIKLVWIFPFDTIDGIKYIAELQNSFIFFFPEFFCFSIYACKFISQCTQSEMFEMMSVYFTNHSSTGSILFPRRVFFIRLHFTFKNKQTYTHGCSYSFKCFYFDIKRFNHSNSWVWHSACNLVLTHEFLLYFVNNVEKKIWNHGEIFTDNAQNSIESVYCIFMDPLAVQYTGNIWID